jgi:hypothetical protein
MFGSALLGAVYGALNLAITGSSRMPYGPFLSVAAAVGLIFRVEVTQFINYIIGIYSYMLPFADTL